MNTIEPDPIPISAIQHFIYCPRRCYLVQIERLWVDNYFTAEGKVGHENVDADHHEKRVSVYKSYHLTLSAKKIGLTGYADLVEFTASDTGVIIPAIHPSTRFQVTPVEYKRGTAKDDTAYRFQLCAQAICLEEMFACVIPSGFLFEEKHHHRVEVVLDDELRSKVMNCIISIRRMLEQITPPRAVYDAKCKNCSLADACVPALAKLPNGSTYWEAFYTEIFQKDSHA